MDINALLSLKPSNLLEFRPRITSPDRFADLIASFAHASGGTIVIGYNRKRRHVVNFKRGQVSRLVEHAEAALGDRNLVDLSFVPVGGREVAVVKVRKVDFLVVSPRGLPVRDNGEVRPMTRAEILQRLTGSKQPLGKEELAGVIENLTTKLNESKTVWEKLLDHSLSYAMSSVVASYGADRVLLGRREVRRRHRWPNTAKTRRSATIAASSHESPSMLAANCTASTARGTSARSAASTSIRSNSIRERNRESAVGAADAPVGCASVIAFGIILASIAVALFLVH